MFILVAIPSIGGFSIDFNSNEYKWDAYKLLLNKISKSVISCFKAFCIYYMSASCTFQCITAYGFCPPAVYYAECCDINTSGPAVNQVGGISNIFQLYQILHIIKTVTNTHLHGLIHPHPLTSKHNSHTSASHRILYANVFSNNKHSISV